MDGELISAACRGDVDEARRLVEAGANAQAIDTSLPAGIRPLDWACIEGQMDVVEYLVEEAQVNVENQNEEGWRALHHACKSNQLNVIRYLVERAGANIEARADRGITPLHISSCLGHFDIVKYFVEQRQANVNVKDDLGRTSLDKALRRGRHDHMVRYFLRRLSSVSEETLQYICANDDLLDTRMMVLEKYAIGRGLVGAFRQHPIHVLLGEFPLASAKAFQDSIHLFPPSFLSVLDRQGRLPIHTALTSPWDAAKSPSIVGFLFDREPRSALARDPTTGLYPHETLAGLITNNDGTGIHQLARMQKRLGMIQIGWLDIVYKIFRSNPQQLLESRVGFLEAQTGRRTKRRKVDCVCNLNSKET